MAVMNSDVRPVYRVLAGIVWFACLVLATWSIFSERGASTVAALLFLVVSTPCMRLVFAGHL
jgi:hypothetical protein